MTGTLRDRLAALLGPGNDDATAYAQADAVLDILGNIDPDSDFLAVHAATFVRMRKAERTLRIIRNLVVNNYGQDPDSSYAWEQIHELLDQ